MPEEKAISSAKVCVHDEVASLRAAREAEPAAVAREVEPEDTFAREAGQLFRRAACERLC